MDAMKAALIKRRIAKQDPSEYMDNDAGSGVDAETVNAAHEDMEAQRADMRANTAGSSVPEDKESGVAPELTDLDDGDPMMDEDTSAMLELIPGEDGMMNNPEVLARLEQLLAEAGGDEGKPGLRGKMLSNVKGLRDKVKAKA